MSLVRKILPLYNPKVRLMLVSVDPTEGPFVLDPKQFGETFWRLPRHEFWIRCNIHSAALRLLQDVYMCPILDSITVVHEFVPKWRDPARYIFVQFRADLTEITNDNPKCWFLNQLDRRNFDTPCVCEETRHVLIQLQQMSDTIAA